MKQLICVFLLSAAAVVTPSAAFACACCIDPGYYEISTARPSNYELGYISDIKFDTVGNLYQSEAGFDGITGLDQLRKDQEADKPFDLNVVEEFLGRSWKMTLQSTTGHEGTLTLPMPRTMVRFKVDLHDNEPGTEPGLYKELRFKGMVGKGTGMFAGDVPKGTTYFLVFQGRGNGCDSSADFTYWHLELSGPRANYSFFGKLIP
jgi:hypothetical protein